MQVDRFAINNARCNYLRDTCRSTLHRPMHFCCCINYWVFMQLQCFHIVAIHVDLGLSLREPSC